MGGNKNKSFVAMIQLTCYKIYFMVYFENIYFAKRIETFERMIK